MIFRRSIWPIVGYLFHPTYMMVNAKILGAIKPDPELCHNGAPSEVLNSLECISAKTYLASFGVASSSLALVLLAIGQTFANGLNNIVPQAYGAKEYKLIGAYLNRMYTLISMIFIPTLLHI